MATLSALNGKDYYDRQNLLNAVAIETAKRAEWASSNGAGKPEDNASWGSWVRWLPGRSAASEATAATNYNAGNDRNSSGISAPTILTDGTAVDHTLQLMAQLISALSGLGVEQRRT